MERSLWTDERIDDMVDRIDDRFDRVDRRLDGLETELRACTREIRGEIAGLRRDMLHGFLIQTAAILGLAAAMVAHSL